MARAKTRKRPKVKSAMRYPGSKEKIADKVNAFFPPSVEGSYLGSPPTCYCEPFIGCGAMLVRIAPRLPTSARVIVADKDPGVVALWRAVRECPRDLVNRLLNFVPSVENFEKLKAEDGKPTGDIGEDAFRKFALHQISFSGLGAKAGGPIGGKSQEKAKYRVDCRFKPERHANVLMEQHRLLKRFKNFEVVHGDFAEALGKVPADGFAYLDPPYYLKGAELYVHNMSPEDHERLAGILRAAPYEWALSYDDHPAVRDLYGAWADVNTFEMVATIDTKRGAGKRRKNSELVITKREAAQSEAA
jgi:DNA adenine methylase